jgi:hypothetical protein
MEVNSPGLVELVTSSRDHDFGFGGAVPRFVPRREICLAQRYFARRGTRSFGAVWVGTSDDCVGVRLQVVFGTDSPAG